MICLKITNMCLRHLTLPALPTSQSRPLILPVSVPQNFGKLDGQTVQQNFGYFEYYSNVRTKLRFLEIYRQAVGAKINIHIRRAFNPLEKSWREGIVINLVVKNSGCQ